MFGGRKSLETQLLTCKSVCGEQDAQMQECMREAVCGIRVLKGLLIESLGRARSQASTRACPLIPVTHKARQGLTHVPKGCCFSEPLVIVSAITSLKKES